MKARHFGPRLFGALALIGALGSARVVFAYSLIGGSWPSGNITLRLQLDATAPTSPALPLEDGSASWNAVATAAMNDWNAYLVRSKLAGTSSTVTTAARRDSISSIFFSDTIYDSTFDQYTLAVTLVDHYDADNHPSVRTSESDLIVNNHRTWNSYRGSVRSSPMDLRRVLLHELGHVLGLDHPDKATPVQVVSSIMNSAVSSIESLQSDDRSGVAYLYGTELTRPTITSQPVAQATTASGSAAFSIRVNGGAGPTPQPALLSYTWYFKPSGATAYERIYTDDTDTLHLGSVQLTDAGSYYVEITTPDVDKTVQSTPAVLSVAPVVTAPGTTLANLSTRGIAGSGSSTMIVGFVVSGSRAKTILLRAVGPTLTKFSVSGVLTDPTLTLIRDGKTLATSAPIWDAGANAAQLRTTSSNVGAFPLNAGSRDAVILTTVEPGNYTALATSATTQTGVVLVEAYDADAVRDGASRLINLSTRGYVGTGGDVMIAGFSVQGPGPHTYLLRVSGASLIPPPFNVTGTLFDPILTLFDNDSVKLRANDDWDSPKAGQPALYSAFQQAGAFVYPYPSTVNGVRDDTAMQSAMVVTLQPGNYTAQASGNDNLGTTSPSGNSLIEIYELP